MRKTSSLLKTGMVSNILQFLVPDSENSYLSWIAIYAPKDNKVVPRLKKS